MGDKSKQRLSENLFAAETISGKVFGKGSKVTSLLGKGEDPLGISRGARKERKAFEVSEKKRTEDIARQKQVEASRLATAESDIAERRSAGFAGRGGRSLLTATSPTGTRARSLGGA